MSKQKKLLQHNKEVLYEVHGYDPREQTKNVHHIVFKSEGGTDEFQNLALLDIETHSFIHQLIDRIERHG